MVVNGGSLGRESPAALTWNPIKIEVRLRRSCVQHRNSIYKPKGEYRHRGVLRTLHHGLDSSD
jgi:hypothetical protein